MEVEEKVGDMATTGHTTMEPILKEDTVQHMECNEARCKDQCKATSKECVAVVNLPHAHTRYTTIGFTATHVGSMWITMDGNAPCPTLITIQM